MCEEDMRNARISSANPRLLPTAKKCFSILCLLSAVVVAPSCVYRGIGKRVRTDPVKFFDASTGAPIQEVLVIPRYSSFAGVGVIPEGPARGARREYLASPFVYRAGKPFSPNQPKSTGLMWGAWVYTGKVIQLEGVLVFAPGYRREWFSDLWPRALAQRELLLRPSSSQSSSRELQIALESLQSDKVTAPDECLFWEPSSACPLDVRLRANERELVRSFLEQALKKLNLSR